MLTEAEYEVMKTHALNGYEMLKHIPQLKDMASTAKYHHEQLDGKGYPFGLKGEDIPQIVSIVTVADCFDAMTTMRPYQEATPVDRVLDIMREEAGIKFDERAVEALIKAIQSGRIATRIQDKIQTKE
jgi:HD-GYP domain-containing protein (c-di-GMP phosphodiesterase class II)